MSRAPRRQPLARVLAGGRRREDSIGDAKPIRIPKAGAASPIGLKIGRRAPIVPLNRRDTTTPTTRCTPQHPPRATRYYYGPQQLDLVNKSAVFLNKLDLCSNELIHKGKRRQVRACVRACV